MRDYLVLLITILGRVGVEKYMRTPLTLIIDPTMALHTLVVGAAVGSPPRDNVFSLLKY